MSAREYQDQWGDEQGWAVFGEGLHESLDNIRRRLGDERHQSLKGALTEALQTYRDQQDLAGFRDVVGRLLDHYYDPMYDYQLAKKADRVRFRGEADAIAEWMQENWRAI